MPTLRVLVVDDDPNWLDVMAMCISRDKNYLSGEPETCLKLEIAVSQEEADAKLQSATEGFDLVFLDLVYPMKVGGPDEHLGERWLPDLRQALPDAAIVICSSYLIYGTLAPLVRMLLGGDVNEAIPKEAKWAEIRDRVCAAIARSKSNTWRAPRIPSP